VSGVLAAGLLLLFAAGVLGLGPVGGWGGRRGAHGEDLYVPSDGQVFTIMKAAARGGRVLPYLLCCAGSVCLVVAGAGGVAGRGGALRLGNLLGFGDAGPAGLGSTTLAADRLSGLFLVIAFGAAAPVSLAFASWAGGRYGTARRGLGSLYALTLGAIAVIITARDAFVLLLGWEALTAAFYLLAGFERHRPGRPGGALVTLVFGKVSGACLLAGLVILAAGSGSMTLASFGHVPPGAARDAGYVLLVAAFGVKAGLVPMQVWLPRGYAAAPGPARAAMAGVGSTVGFYGLWRTLDLLGAPPGWLAGLLLALAGLTAVLGIAHAAVATQLPRLIAYSSVENTGLIVVGFGVALTGAATHEPPLVAVGLLAATLQVIAHTFAKSLLMLSGAGIESAVGTDVMDGLRGAGRRVPGSGAGLAIGALTLAGLPPTAGFVSEWFLLESLMQQFRVPGLGYRLVLAVAGAAVALTAGFAGVTFVRVIGLVVLGPPPGGETGAQAGRAGGVGTAAAQIDDAQAHGGQADDAQAYGGQAYGGHADDGRADGGRAGVGPDYGWTGRAGLALLALACLGVAALTPLEIRVIGRGLAAIVPAGVSSGALRSPWVVQPVYAGFSILSPSWLWLVMPSLFLVVTGLTWLAAGRRLTRVRRVPAWRSATAGVDGTSSYTPFGFANPARRVLASVLLTRAELRHLEEPVDTGGEPGAPAVPHLRYLSDVVELVEAYLYRPLARPALWLVRTVKRLQSGRLDAYLGYMLIALVAVIAVVAALG
jgi:formate hydrogenlyase subunit 3/multisubunit Na+/H+ antiporter MnhD subunit